MKSLPAPRLTTKLRTVDSFSNSTACKWREHDEPMREVDIPLNAFGAMYFSLAWPTNGLPFNYNPRGIAITGSSPKGKTMRLSFCLNKKKKKSFLGFAIKSLSFYLLSMWKKGRCPTGVIRYLIDSNSGFNVVYNLQVFSSFEECKWEREYARSTYFLYVDESRNDGTAIDFRMTCNTEIRLRENGFQVTIAQCSTYVN